MLNYELWTMNDKLWTMNYERWTMNDELWTMNYELWAVFKALFANQQFTIDEMHNYRMAVTEREVVH